MSMVSSSHKFVYVSGGRNATGSIHAALQSIPNIKYFEPAKKKAEYWKKYNKHMPAYVIRNVIGKDVWDSYFTFSFVRNTFSWIVSSYFFWVKIGMRPMPANGIMTMKDFEFAVEYYQSPVGKRFDENTNIRSQHSFLSNSKGKLIVNFVGKFETLQEDYNHICQVLKVEPQSLAVRNTSMASRADWKEHYRQNPGAKDLVEKYWQRDIEAFNFRLEI